MANLTETTQWEPGIYQFTTDDLVEGGPNGIDNLPTRQLANRTQYLKGQVESLGQGKQPADATLTALAALVGTADKLPYFTGNDQLTLAVFTAFARQIIACTDAASVRTLIDAVTHTELSNAVTSLVNSSPAALDTLKELADALGDDPNFATTITTALGNKQPLDATLTALAGLNTAANKLIYATGTDQFAMTDLLAFGKTLLACATKADAATALGLASSVPVYLTGTALPTTNIGPIWHDDYASVMTYRTVGTYTGYASVNLGKFEFFAANTIPTGYLKANGATLTTSYAALIAYLGTSTLPDLRGEFLRGFDDGRGVDSGRVIRSFQDQAFLAHSHGSDGSVVSIWGSQGWWSFPGGNTVATTAIQSTGGTETRPRNIAGLVCIKY